MKNNKNTLKPLEPSIIKILTIAGILANFAGLIVSLLFKANYINILPTMFCLAFQLIVFLFRNKISYAITGLLLSFCCSNILFPLILITDKGINGAFVFYLFIAPVAYGVSVKKKWLVVLPLFTLIEYIWLFAFINNHIYQAVGRNLVSNCISFSIAFIFVFSYANYFANTAIRYNKKLLKLTYHDDLTGLFNRRKLECDLNNKRFKYCIMIDIDNFHDCNNENGHQFGDLVLKKFADICLFLSNDEFRVYRYGGEEFLILSRFNESKIIEKIKKIMNLFYKEFGITISVGVSRNTDFEAPEQIIKKADEAMFFVKAHGKNDISFGTNLVLKDKNKKLNV